MEDVSLDLPEADGLGGSQTRSRLQTRKQRKRGEGLEKIEMRRVEKRSHTSCQK